MSRSASTRDLGPRSQSPGRRLPLNCPTRGRRPLWTSLLPGTRGAAPRTRRMHPHFTWVPARQARACPAIVPRDCLGNRVPPGPLPMTTSFGVEAARPARAEPEGCVRLLPGRRGVLAHNLQRPCYLGECLAFCRWHAQHSGPPGTWQPIRTPADVSAGRRSNGGRP